MRPLIVGAGPAGCAAAITLARGGITPVLVERSREPGDALCGGFLSWRSLEALAGLGTDARDLNAEAIRSVRLFAGHCHAEALLPAPGLAVSRHRLDSLLLERAAAAGAGVEQGVAVREVQGTKVRLQDGTAIDPPALLLASGKHDVRGLPRPATARGRDPTLGLRLRLPPCPTLTRLIGNSVELHLLPGGYAGLALQEDGSANLCLAVHRSATDAAGGPAAYLRTLGDAGPLGERLAGADLDARFDAVANVPYGWRVGTGADRLFRLGDQAGVIPSLAGEGMGIALASGIDAARTLLTYGPGAAPTWQRRFDRRLRRPIGVADAVRALAEGRGRGALVSLARVPGLIQVVAAATRIAHHMP
ncbi:FAD-dependent monooxygenase [Sphingomonas aerophila]|uniref:Flavin-dependent dehydrogenase n=1 Tax=Sphingomonas aerophila TaxID=1344948 RepID=A0A7W9BAA3_9SPHN|nr:flavin-dependent dehydrogenase [Sphingomonas aerophila]